MVGYAFHPPPQPTHISPSFKIGGGLTQGFGPDWKEVCIACYKFVLMRLTLVLFCKPGLNGIDYTIS